MQPPLILVVEDSDTLRYVAKRQLQSLGFSCDVAADGNEAIARAAEKRYDLIFMDVQMPNMDGLAATVLIRRAEEASGHKPVPIIAVTANPDKPACLEVGMNDFIFKPVMLDDLQTMVERWLGKH